MNKPVVSWLIKTTKNSVEYIDAIGGEIKDSSLLFRFNVEDMVESKSLFVISKKIIKNIFKDNKGVKAKLNLMRFFMASLFEILVYNKDRFF